MTMRIVPLHEWFPQMDRRWLNEGRRLTVPIASRKGYTVHHTAGGFGIEEYTYARQVAEMHFNKWRRPGGYNFLIGTAGTIFAMCDWEHVGAHAPGCNYNSIGVSFQGIFDDQLPERIQLAAFGWLVATHPVPNAQQGHRDCSSTSCPGNTLYRHLPLKVGIPDPDPEPPEEIDFMADPEIANALARLADASAVRAQADISAELAAIRTRSGLAPEPDSDAVWIERIISGERTLAEAARAIADKTDR